MVPWKDTARRKRRRGTNRLRKTQSVPSFPQYQNQQQAGSASGSGPLPGGRRLTSQYSFPRYHLDQENSSVHLGESLFKKFGEEEEMISGKTQVPNPNPNPNPNPTGFAVEEDQDQYEATSTQARQFNSTPAESETIHVAGVPENQQYPTMNQIPIPKTEMPHLILRERQKKIEYLPLHVRLYQAALKGDWRLARSVLEIYPPAVRVAITGGSETALHIAAAAKQTHFVEKLVDKMNSDDMTLKNKHGNTALCFAAASGIVKIAEVMVKKNGALPLVRGYGEVTPLFMAVTYKRKDMVSYLYSVTDFDDLKDEEQIGLLIATISTDYFDIGLKILQKKPKLAIMRGEDDETALHVMALKPSAIGSKRHLNIWEKCINFSIKGIYNKALMKTLACQLVESLWKSVLLELSEEDMLKFIKEPTRLLHDAASVGNVEFLILLIRSFPDLVWKIDDSQKSIFHIAVENRHETVFNLIYEIGGLKDFIANFTSTESNYNMLHLAGKLAAPNHLNRVSGAALQMQRELLWFKEVEKIVLASFLKAKCDYKKESLELTPRELLWIKELEKISFPFHYKEKFDYTKTSVKLTPRELFTLEHKDLRQEGEIWMKTTANSCMLVATLIATVVFAAAFTVPGGNESSTGIPILGRKDWFTVFAISDAIALVSSTTSILLFLSILTSRYAEDDFLHSLPSRLLLGLAALFISIVCMVVAFSATFFMIYSKGKMWVPEIVAAMAVVPVSCYGVLQFKLWADTFRYTYWSRFLFKSRRRRLF